MPRPWNIEEQEFTVPEIGYKFQFSSVHSEEVAAGNDAPAHDQEIFMKMWDPSGIKCLMVVFDRNGFKVRTELDTGSEPPQGAEPQDGVATATAGDEGAQQSRAEDASYQDVQPKPFDGDLSRADLAQAIPTGRADQEAGVATIDD